ncbi:MAG TPA: 3-carboxy-cis,cis-muconate cycloisomerase [Vicinamibacterales bacterium]|nr:3-carboxy-cis,cis-muconate cycloisomerase [Vicinamibacterales bacterium]
MRLLESLATTDPLEAVFSDAAFLAAMLHFEVALARAEARHGIIPPRAAEVIAQAADPQAFDAAAIARAARASGTVTIPFVEALTARVRALDPGAETFVHWGATSQDVADTALVLCLVQARPVLDADCSRLATALRRLSDEHADTIMLGRTLMQPAAPITFGLKSAGWFAAVTRCHRRLTSAFEEACVLQFGGASGTLAALGGRGPVVATELARELALPCPDAPWHTQRDRLAVLAADCGILTATLGKIARDVSLLMQHEIGEAAEPGGGSSTMPQKRNPAGCALALAAATRLPGLVASYVAGMVQEHERGLGGWHAEAVTVAGCVQATGAALAAVAQVAETLRVDSARMRANVAATNTTIFAERAMVLLAPPLGRHAAARLVAAAVESSRQEGRSFVEVLAASPDVAAVLGADADAWLGLPEQYLGSAELFRRALLGTGTD